MRQGCTKRHALIDGNSHKESPLRRLNDAERAPFMKLSLKLPLAIGALLRRSVTRTFTHCGQPR